MGIGQSQPSNAVYWDADANQYYTLGSQSSNPVSSIYGTMSNIMNPGAKNYLGATLGSVNNKSMVDENTARAKAAYEAVLSNLASSPAYNQSAMFPGLSSPSDTQVSQAPMNMYGAGRFLSPAQGQQTGGVLGFNFNSSQNQPMQQQMQPSMRNNMPPANAYLNPSQLTRGNLGYMSQYTNAGDDVWAKIMASAPQRPADMPRAFAASDTSDPATIARATNFFNQGTVTK